MIGSEKTTPKKREREIMTGKITAKTDELSIAMDWMRSTLNGVYDVIAPIFMLRGESSVSKKVSVYLGYENKDVIYTKLREKDHNFKTFRGSEAYYYNEFGLFEGALSADSNGRKMTTLFLTGSQWFIDFVQEVISELNLATKPPEVKRVIETSSGFNSVNMDLQIKAIPELNFYPYFKKTPEQIWEGFSESPSNVLLLIGEPGTGKSAFIRRMMDHRGYENTPYLVDNEEILLKPALMSYLQSAEDMKLIIAEDADNFVGKRENNNQSMTALLSLSEGIASGNTKIILSTNLANISKVDPALIRAGRCHQVLNFEKLSVEDANIIRASTGIETLITKPSTLAVTLNAQNGAESTFSSVGFV